MGAAHAACGVDAAVLGPAQHILQPADVGPRIRADAGQGHDDDPVGPERRIIMRISGSDRPVRIVIERQHASRSPAGASQRLRVLERLAADDAHAGAGLGAPAERGWIGLPAVDPDLELRMGVGDLGDDRVVAAHSANCVEIRDVKPSERGEREQRLGDGLRPGALDERGMDRLVGAPLSAARMHHLAAHEVDDRNDVHCWPHDSGGEAPLLFG